MWDWNLYENSAVLAEGQRRSLCACITAILIGSALLALLIALSPNSPGFYGVLTGGGIILFMGVAGIVLMCIYYPMDCCKRGGGARNGLRPRANASASPVMPKLPPAVPEYEAPPSYEETVAKREAV